MTDLDHEAAKREELRRLRVALHVYAQCAECDGDASCEVCGGTGLEPEAESAYVAIHCRIARLEALVRELGKCRFSIHRGNTSCDGGRLKYSIDGRDPEQRDEPCPNCAGTGLVEAAREELSHE